MIYKLMHFIGRFCYIFRIFKIKQNKIYFVSNDGTKYACNSRALFEWMYANHKDEFEFYYSMNNRKVAKKQLPKGVKHHRYMSLLDLYHLHTSRYVVNNFRFFPFFMKRKGQVYIQIWHGGPIAYKKIERDAPNLPDFYKRMAENDNKLFDMLAVGSSQCSELFAKCFNAEGKIVMTGNPRCDVVINGTNNDKIRKELGISEDDFVVLYAPTFRKKEPLEKCFLDNETLYETIKKITNKNVKILYRFHPNLARKTAKLNFGDRVQNVTSYEDMQDIISISDILITDFSTCMFDMMIAGKQSIIYARNSQQYLSEERGVYLSYKEFPCPIAYTFEELQQVILDVNKNKENYKKKVKEFLDGLGCIEDGHACERCYDALMSFDVNKQKK